MRCAPFFKQALYFAETDRQKAAVSRCFQEKRRQAYPFSRTAYARPGSRIPSMRRTVSRKRKKIIAVPR
jgi:hypothetical protein